MDLTPKQQKRIETAPITWRKSLTLAILGKASPRAAIKAQCGECMGFDRDEIEHCTAEACPLWNYRPFRKGLKPLRVRAGGFKAASEGTKAGKDRG